MRQRRRKKSKAAMAAKKALLKCGPCDFFHESPPAQESYCNEQKKPHETAWGRNGNGSFSRRARPSAGTGRVAWLTAFFSRLQWRDPRPNHTAFPASLALQN